MLAAYMQGSLVMLGGFGWIYTASAILDGSEPWSVLWSQGHAYTRLSGTYLTSKFRRTEPHMAEIFRLGLYAR